MKAASFTRGALFVALTALSGGIAQASTTSVTLYGVIDLGLAFERRHDSTESSSHSHVGMRDGIQSGSRWGLRGVEDLGNGYSVVFRLESGFHASNGTEAQGRLFGRWAYLGLVGDFGELRAGRQQVLSDSWGGVGSPFGTSWGGASASVTSGYNDGDFGNGGRANNAFIYRTPVWSGWQAGLGYSFEAHDNNKFATANHDRVWTAGLRYRDGPLSTALTYEHLNPDASVPGKLNSRNLQVAAAYDFDVLKLHAGYGNLRNPNIGPSAGVRRVNSFVTGVGVPINGSSKVLAAYQRATSSHIKGWGLGYEHDLSKRTNIYALLDRVDHRESHTLQSVVGLRHHF